MKEKPYCYEYPRPSVTVDIVLFHQTGAGLEVLLIKRRHEPFADHWALPGGFVDENESLEAAATRELREETRHSRARFQPIGAFGDPGRDPRGHTVIVAFTALLKSKGNAATAVDAKDVGWHKV